ncbi:MAG TPA: ABC transporter permease [Clostridia bacterium]|nr:ABC transporter permease [Clostridia bacterium]
MKLQRVLAVSRKEFLHIRRDPRSLAVAIAIPMLMLLLFGYALTLDVDNVPLIVWDQSQTSQSRELVSNFTGSRYFSLLGYADTARDVEAAIDSGEALAGLVIPRDFSQQFEAGRTVQVQVITDATDSNTAVLALGYAEMATQAFSRQATVQKLKRAGLTPPRAPLDVRPRVWFNTDLESKNYIIPGLIAVIMMVIAALLTSLTVAREWETGTMEQLIATPIRGVELITGKLLPYFALGMLDVVLAVGMGEVLFHVPLRGSVLLLFSVSAVFLVGVLSLGMLISIAAKKQLLASQTAMVVTFVPSFLLSGFMFSIANMPVPIQVLTHLIPARYFVSIIKGIYLKGVGVQVLAAEIALLGAFAVVMFALANVKFRKRLV